MKTQTLTKTARRILLAAAVSTTVLTASAAGNWTGGGADTKWSTPENWNSEAVPTSGDIRFWEPQDFVSPFKDLDEKVVLFDDAYNPSSTIYVRKVGTADNPLVFEATSSANGLNAGEEWKIGYNDNEPGYLRLKSGTWSTASGKVMTLGKNNSKTWGELAVTDGAILTLGGNLNVLRGKVTLENASLIVDNGYNVNFGQYNGLDSVFELKVGGVFTTPFVRQYPSSSGGGTFLFNGGVLKANKADGSGFIQNSAYLTVKVGAGGGTIDADGNNISIKCPIKPDGEDGGMKFIGGSTITFDAAPTYTGGTTVELGTKLVASDSTAKTAILGNGLIVDGRLKLASGPFDLFECSGLVPADLDKITFVNCGEGTEPVFDDEDSPTKIVVNFVVPACVGTSPVKVWSGKTLDEIAYGSTFTARFAGASNSDTRCVPNSSTGYYEKVLRDEDGSVTNIIVEFQRQKDENVRCVVVSFENGEDGIYATGLGAKWIANKTVGNYEFCNNDRSFNSCNDITLAATPTANYYTVFDLRVDTPSTKVWTLDSDNTTWSTLRGDETLSSDTVVVIKATGDYTLVVDENVNVGQIVFVDGTGSTLSVASGNTLTTESVSGIGNILNAGTLVKTGDGTATMPFDNTSTGDTIVNAGTLKVASVTGTGTAHTVRVKSGATFDLNCVWQTAVAVVLEGGANFANTGSSDAVWGSAINIRSLTLEGDATVTATRTFGLRTTSHDANTLDLGTYTLTVNASGKDFIVDNTTINGTGKIVVASGRLASYNGSHGDDYTLEVRSGASLLGGGGGITCCNFVNNGTVTETVKVKGVLTTGNAIPNLTLVDGATVKATGAAQTVSSTFNASGAYTIDASEISAATLREGNVPVLTVPASFKTSSATWAVSGEPISGTRHKWVDNGDDTKTLYLARPTGLMLIFR